MADATVAGVDPRYAALMAAVDAARQKVGEEPEEPVVRGVTNTVPRGAFIAMAGPGRAMYCLPEANHTYDWRAARMAGDRLMVPGVNDAGAEVLALASKNGDCYVFRPDLAACGGSEVPRRPGAEEVDLGDLAPCAVVPCVGMRGGPMAIFVAAPYLVVYTGTDLQEYEVFTIPYSFGLGPVSGARAFTLEGGFIGVVVREDKRMLESLLVLDPATGNVWTSHQFNGRVYIPRASEESLRAELLTQMRILQTVVKATYTVPPPYDAPDCPSGFAPGAAPSDRGMAAACDQAARQLLRCRWLWNAAYENECAPENRGAPLPEPRTGTISAPFEVDAADDDAPASAPAEDAGADAAAVGAAAGAADAADAAEDAAAGAAPAPAADASDPSPVYEREPTPPPYSPEAPPAQGE